MRLLLLLFIASFAGVCNSQTCLSGTTEMNQTDIDNFATDYPGCTEILGTINILNDVSDLSGLSQLTRVNGDFKILSNNNNILTLAGLENITSYYRLQISGSNIVDAEALSNIETIGSSITIGNTAITDLDLNKLKSVGQGLNISGNTRLKSLNKLDSLTSMSSDGFIFINYNDSLEYIDAFHELESAYTIRLISNYHLKTLNIFSNVKTVLDEIHIVNADSLTFINTFDSLKTLGGLNIGGMPRMKEINIFPNLESVLYDQDYGSSGFLSISYMDSLTNICNFPKLEFVGNISLVGNNMIQDIDPFATVTAIDYSISIFNCAILTDITGIANINPATVNVIDIRDNPLLTECSISNICQFLELSGQSFTIQNNGTNCNSATEILNLCCHDTLTLPWDPILSGTYKSSGNIYLETNALSDNQNIILSHGVDSSAHVPSNLTLGQNATLTVQDTGCND